MTTLGVIPARGGSKGIPRKNIRMLFGRPLIAWTIDAARVARRLDRVVVSTEDEEIARVARDCGAEVPFLRPAHLALDKSPGVDPALHALEMLPGFDAVVLLQPTSPLRTAMDIDDCIDLAERMGAPAAVSITQSDKHPNWMYFMGESNRLAPVMQEPAATRRQDLPIAYALNGAVYFAKADELRASQSFLDSHTVGYVMPRERSLDLDTNTDWEIAELLLGRRS